mgnify:CR=1 FL=1
MTGTRVQRRERETGGTASTRPETTSQSALMRPGARPAWRRRPRASSARHVSDASEGPWRTTSWGVHGAGETASHGLGRSSVRQLPPSRASRRVEVLRRRRGGPVRPSADRAPALELQPEGVHRARRDGAPMPGPAAASTREEERALFSPRRSALSRQCDPSATMSRMRRGRTWCAPVAGTPSRAGRRRRRAGSAGIATSGRGSAARRRSGTGRPRRPSRSPWSKSGAMVRHAVSRGSQDRRRAPEASSSRNR